MKQLTCEMCGSTDMLKEDGVFVCQSCGCKYSVEEAKKLMVEVTGTVEVKGTVKIDKSEDLKKWYQLAQRARENDNSKEAIKYYELILLEKPDDWEAAFFKLYYSTIDCRFGEIPNRLYEYAHTMNSVFELIDRLDMDEKENAMDIVYQYTVNINIVFTSNINTIADVNLNSSCNMAKRNAYNKLGDLFANYSHNSKYAIQCYEICLKNVRPEQDRAPIIQKIKKLDPSYNPSTFQKSGCYIATCVYGSYDCPEVWILRRYRDETLGSTWYGRLFIRTYYAISPTLVKWFGNTNWFKKMWKGNLDQIVAKLQRNGVESTPYEDKEW